MNGSTYRLQRTIDQNNQQAVDTIESILSSDPTSQLLVSITLAPGYSPNLLFILSLCYGIKKLKDTADSDFFALALVLNVC
jgi:hypothetical protein